MKRHAPKTSDKKSYTSMELLVGLRSVERYLNSDENWIPALQVCRRMASFDESLIGAALKSYLRGTAHYAADWESHSSWSALDDQDWLFLADELLHTGS